MNIPNMPLNGFNLAYDICHTKDVDSNAYNFLKESESIFKLIHSSNINNKELINRIDSLKDIFLKCTKEDVPESEFSLEDKINLKYAFRDILDQVNLQMHQTATIRNSQQGPTGFIPIDSQITLALYVGNLAFNTLMYVADRVLPHPEIYSKHEFSTTEEDVIKKVQKALVSMERNKRFDRYEAQLQKKKKEIFQDSSEKDIKTSFANFFNIKIKPSPEEIEKAKEKEKSIKLIDRCIEVKNIMDSEHVIRNQDLSITPPPIDWNGLFDPLLQNIYSTLIDCEKILIEDTLKPYTPKEFFEGKSLDQFLVATIDSKTSKTSKLKNLLFKAFGENAVQDLRERLSNNLKFITEDYNLARLAISMNTNIVKMLSAVHKLDEDSTQEDLIKGLGITDKNGNPLTAEKFIQMVHSDSITNLSKLCVLECKESADTVGGFIQSTWTSAGNASLEKTLATIISTKFNTQDLKELLNKVPHLPSKNPIPGWGRKESDKINRHMNIILLFLASNLINEMTTIASEARKAKRKNLPTDVSGIADEKAVEEVKKSTLEVVKALRSLTFPTKDEAYEMVKTKNPFYVVVGALSQHLTFSFIDYVVNVQGEGYITDIMTPIYKEFIQKWTTWISE